MNEYKKSAKLDDQGEAAVNQRTESKHVKHNLHR
jgi:hypothetical protein